MLTSAKLIHHFKKLLLASSQHKLISKCAKFHFHYAYSSEVMGRAFLSLLLQIKYPTPDKPNNITLTFSPKNQLLQVGRKRIFTISLKTHKTYKNLQKSLCCSFVAVLQLCCLFCTIKQFFLLIKLLINSF